MNVLIFYGTDDFSSANLAIEYINKGHDVTILTCGGFYRTCRFNHYGLSACCSYCTHKNNNYIKKTIKGYKSCLSLNDIVIEEDIKTAENFEFSFNSVDEVKAVIYKNVEVGYGALSTYVSSTRNIVPTFTDELKTYLTRFIRQEIAVFEAVNRYVKEKGTELMIFHNGRYHLFKPFLGVAQTNQIDFIATEHYISKGVMMENNFYNDVPHSVSANIEKMNKLWEKTPKGVREEMGRSFYERRAKGIAAGDKVYILDQKDGSMPEDWDETVENISIFNSSEDEFCAISREYDKRKLFKNQYVGLKAIFDHFKDDKTKHFYLRIHPNLKNIKTASVLDLYKLEYDNVTIIPPSSPISSYALMHHSDKIIVFDSTMGMESAYWGKPVISLTKFYATELKCSYDPNSEEELWGLLDSKLEVMSNENLLKFGLYMLYEIPNPIKNVNVYVSSKKILGHQENIQSVLKFMGSHTLNHLIFIFFNTNIPFVKKLLMPFAKVKAVPGYKRL